MRTIIATLVIALAVVYAAGAPRVDAQASPVYEYQHWKIADRTEPNGVSALTLNLNNLSSEGWELVGAPFLETDVYGDGSRVRNYNVIARRIKVVGTPTPVAPTATTITCPGDAHPACRILPSGGPYDLAWANAVAGIR